MPSDLVETTPRVTLIMAYIGQIRRLATGVERYPETPPPTIPRANIEAAYAMALEVEKEVDEIVRTPNAERPGYSGMLLKLAINEAASGASRMRDTIEMRLLRRGPDVPPAPSGTLTVDAAKIYAAWEFLEFLTGERPWHATAGPALDRAYAEFWYDNAELAVGMIPVVGQLFDLSMAIYGKTLLGEDRSMTERVLLAAGALVPVAGKAVARGVRVTYRTIAAAKFAAVGKTVVNRLRTAIEMVPLAVVMRDLTKNELSELAQLGRKMRAGGRLTQNEASRAAYFMVRIRETAIAAEWLDIVAKETGRAEAKGRFLILRGVESKVGEREALERVAKELNEQVVALPQLSPLEYRAGRASQLKRTVQLSGEKHPDGQIGRTLAEVMVPQTENIEKVLDRVPGKRKQAGILILMLETRSPIRAAEVEPHLTRVWGSPHAAGLNRIILIDKGNFFKVVQRPSPYLVLSTADQAAQAAAATAASLHRRYEEASQPVPGDY